MDKELHRTKFKCSAGHILVIECVCVDDQLFLSVTCDCGKWRIEDNEKQHVEKFVK